jgi:uncharacterized protein (TIGR03083 family)
MDVMAEAAADRAELADLLDTLTPELWEAPSLCTGWRVRDVVAHLVSWEGTGRGELARRLVRARLRPGRLNEVGFAPFCELPADELVRLLRDHLVPSGPTARFHGGVGLVDSLIHQQDIRRPLGLRRDIPSARLGYALRFALFAPPLRGAWKGRGTRLVATDLDWSFGRGPEARGPAEAVLMVLAGRRGAAGELSGPGRQVLVERFG